MSNQRGKKGRAVSGWVVLDKPAGMGSTQCVGKIKWIFQAAKAGHAGTLDPLATGLLPLALGEATRTVPYVMNTEKTYRFKIAWGAETNTDDLEGQITRTSSNRPVKSDIMTLLPNYRGTIEQIPPQFSAVKIDGVRAYKLAREGEEVEIKPRTVTIRMLDLITCDDETATFETRCNKGTYVRAIARDMGRDLGCFGHIVELRRTSVGPFFEEDMTTLEDIIALEGDLDALDAELFTTGTALDALPEVVVNGPQIGRLRLGNSVILRGRESVVHTGEAIAVSGDELVAIGEVDCGQFKPKRIFRHSFV